VRRLLHRAGEPGGEVMCGCCGRDLPRSAVKELGITPDVFICRRCAMWAAVRVGRNR